MDLRGGGREWDKAWPRVFKEKNKNICLLVPYFPTRDNFPYMAGPPYLHLWVVSSALPQGGRLHLQWLFDPAQPSIFPLIFFCCPAQAIFCYDFLPLCILYIVLCSPTAHHALDGAPSIHTHGTHTAETRGTPRVKEKPWILGTPPRQRHLFSRYTGPKDHTQPKPTIGDLSHKATQTPGSTL